MMNVIGSDVDQVTTRMYVLKNNIHVVSIKTDIYRLSVLGLHVRFMNYCSRY